MSAAKSCILYSMEGEKNVVLPDNEVVYLGRNEVTGLTDMFLHPKQLSAQANYKKFEVILKVYGTNFTVCNGREAMKGKVHVLKHDQILELELRRYIYLLKFDPPPPVITGGMCTRTYIAEAKEDGSIYLKHFPIKPKGGSTVRSEPQKPRDYNLPSRRTLAKAKEKENMRLQQLKQSRLLELKTMTANSDTEKNDREDSIAPVAQESNTTNSENVSTETKKIDENIEPFVNAEETSLLSSEKPKETDDVFSEYCTKTKEIGSICLETSLTEVEHKHLPISGSIGQTVFSSVSDESQKIEDVLIEFPTNTKEVVNTGSEMSSTETKKDTGIQSSVIELKNEDTSSSDFKEYRTDPSLAKFESILTELNNTLRESKRKMSLDLLSSEDSEQISISSKVNICPETPSAVLKDYSQIISEVSSVRVKEDSDISIETFFPELKDEGSLLEPKENSTLYLESQEIDGMYLESCVAGSKEGIECSESCLAEPRQDIDLCLEPPLTETEDVDTLYAELSLLIESTQDIFSEPDSKKRKVDDQVDEIIEKSPFSNDGNECKKGGID